MKYDWTTIIDRVGHDAMAFERVGAPGSRYPAPKEGFDIIPMWVADMNFATCPTIQEAMIERVKHPCFGYFYPKEEYYAAIIEWQERQHGVTGLKKEDIPYVNGVMGGLTAALNVLCSRGDHVLLHSPTYIGFTGTLDNLGLHAVHTALVQDENGIWRMNYEEMEELIRSNHIHCAILCSPHNPCGRVWERQELEKAMALFEKYEVYVISDEIWSDIIMSGYHHIPTQQVSDYARTHTIALYAPSKTFNLAGLVGAYSIVYDPWLRDRFEKELSMSHMNMMNVLYQYALLGAYRPEGYEWVRELNETLEGNIDFAVNYIRGRWDGVRTMRPQGTYMLFVDCGEWCRKHGKTLDEVLQTCYDVGVVVQDGRRFYGKSHIRMNLASPLSRIREGFERLDRYLFNAPATV